MKPTGRRFHKPRLGKLAFEILEGVLGKIAPAVTPGWPVGVKIYCAPPREIVRADAVKSGGVRAVKDTGLEAFKLCDLSAWPIAAVR